MIILRSLLGIIFGSFGGHEPWLTALAKLREGSLSKTKAMMTTSPWRPRKIPCATNRSEEIERHSHGSHLAAMGSSLGGACRETAPALGTASSGMRSPCLPSLTVRVARQTSRYGCELGWVAKQHFLSRAAAASWSGPSCQEGIAAASPPPTEAGAHQPRYPVTDNHTVQSHRHPWSCARLLLWSSANIGTTASLPCDWAFSRLLSRLL